MEDRTPQRDGTEAFSPRSATALRELEQRARTALSAQQGHLARLEDQISKQLEVISAAIAGERSSEAEGLKQVEAARSDVDRLREDFEKTRAAWQAEKAGAEAEIARQRAEIEKLTAQNEKRAEQLAEREAKLKSGKAEAESDALAALKRERDELQQKFDLALQDVQRFRGRSADLEQELARRPEASQADSAELVALRAERDALAERVDHLERQPVAPADGDAAQQIADFRRRFELAVEDVRELKNKNAELEAKLAASGNRPAASAEGGGMDWESQKRRLLASLEEATGDEESPLPQQDRITIENTIEMTDAVVAEKDREIEQLKAKLAAPTAATEPDRSAQEREEQVAELLNADEVIAEHRKRIEKLEREMEQKLRAAELEVSVERAKITREKAELEELRIELEKHRRLVASGGPGAGSSSAPRRRWLSKLGLSGEDQN